MEIAGFWVPVCGFSEVLTKEVRPFGIKVTALAPGSFRTDWAGCSMVRAGRSMADYDALFDPIRRARGQQAGDLAKAAEVLLQIVAAENPPTHLLLGNDALKLVREKLTDLEAEITFWEALSRSTDFV